jgi:predicted ribosomally synthesized peptide with nif11-like leader
MSSSTIDSQVLDFVKRMADEPDFRAQFAQTDDRSEIITKLRDAGYTFSFEEFRQTMETLAKSSPDALPDELLEGVSGGNGVVNFLSGFGKVVADIVKSVGDNPFPGVDAKDLTDWAGHQLAKGIKSVVNVFK